MDHSVSCRYFFLLFLHLTRKKGKKKVRPPPPLPPQNWVVGGAGVWWGGKKDPEGMDFRGEILGEVGRARGRVVGHFSLPPSPSLPLSEKLELGKQKKKKLK